jgi:hypothetical protein
MKLACQIRVFRPFVPFVIHQVSGTEYLTALCRSCKSQVLLGL